MAEAQRSLREELGAQAARVAAHERRIDDIRYQMAQRETELLLVLREVASCDLWAPAHHFDGDRLLKQGRYEQLATGPEQYRLPLSTFWRPVDLGDAYVDPKSKEGHSRRYTQRVPTDSQSEGRGPFLARPIAETVRQRLASRSGSRGRPSGSPHDRTLGPSLLREAGREAWKGTTELAFTKLTNPSFAREQEDLRAWSTQLRSKITPGGSD